MYELETGHRASYADKDAARERLNYAYGEGRLDDREYRRRMDQIDGEVTHQGQLRYLTQDLPEPETVTARMARTAVGKIMPREAYRYAVAIVFSMMATWLSAMWAYFSTGGSAGDLAGAALAVIFGATTVVVFVGMLAKYVN